MDLEWRAKYMRQYRQRNPTFAVHLRDREEVEVVRRFIDLWRKKNGKPPRRVPRVELDGREDIE